MVTLAFAATLAHAGGEAMRNLWLAWTLDPFLLISLALLGAYLYALGRCGGAWACAGRSACTRPSCA